MSDSFTSSLRLQLQATGNNSGTWGNIADTQYQLLSDAITGDNGYGSGGGVNLNGLLSYTLTAINGSADQARQQLYPFVGNLAADCTVTIPGVVKIGQAVNATTGGHNVVMTTGGSGNTLLLPPGGAWVDFYCDGSNIFQIPLALNGALQGTITNDNAAPGQVGEYISTTSGAFNLGSDVHGTLAEIQITPGDWDVSGSIEAFPSSGSTISGGSLGISTDAFSTPLWPSGGVTSIIFPPQGNANQVYWTGPVRWSVPVNTNLFISTRMIFVGSVSAAGFISARRRR